MAQTMIRGTGSAFLTTRGRPRIATMEGKTYVVGRGKATEVADMTAAQGVLTERLAAEKAKRLTKRARPLAAIAVAEPIAAAAVGGLVGRVARFEIDGRKAYGKITEIGTRAVRLVRKGETWLRAESDLELQPEGGDYCDTCFNPTPHQCCDACAEAEVRAVIARGRDLDVQVRRHAAPQGRPEAPVSRRPPKLSVDRKRVARMLVGKTIKSIALCPFDPERFAPAEEAATDPVILFTDGTSLRFIVEETEVEYGVKLIYPARPYRAEPPMPAASPLGRPPTKHPRDHRR